MRPVKLDQDDNEGGEQNYNNFMIDYRGAMQKREGNRHCLDCCWVWSFLVCAAIGVACMVVVWIMPQTVGWDRFADKYERANCTTIFSWVDNSCNAADSKAQRCGFSAVLQADMLLINSTRADPRSGAQAEAGGGAGSAGSTGAGGVNGSTYAVQIEQRYEDQEDAATMLEEFPVGSTYACFFDATAIQDDGRLATNTTLNVVVEKSRDNELTVQGLLAFGILWVLFCSYKGMTNLRVYVLLRCGRRGGRGRAGT